MTYNIEIKSPNLLAVINKTMPEAILLGRIKEELLTCIGQAPVSEYKEKYIHSWLDEKLEKDLLLKSFENKLILIYDEIIIIEVLVFLHTWFKKNACKIENIIVIATCTYDSLSNWYKQYCDLYGTKGFVLIETAWIYAMYFLAWKQNNPLTSKLYQKKQFKNYFEYFGGQRSEKSRDFATAALLTVAELGHIEYLGGFQSSLDEFDAYLEEISGYSNRPKCDEIVTARTNPRFNHLASASHIPGFDVLKSPHTGISAFTVLRETSYNETITVLTEKTLKAFISMTLPLPMGYKSVDELTKLGFKFDHSLIDYSYQYEKTYFDRIIKLVDEIKRLSTSYTLDELSERFYNNRSIIEHNYNYIVSNKVFNNIQDKLIRDLNEQRL